jgi:hypothetical protein
MNIAPTQPGQRRFTLEVSEQELQEIERGLYLDHFNYALWDKVDDFFNENNICVIRHGAEAL